MEKILIVDDERDIRQTIHTYLKDKGYAVMEAADAEEAWQHLAEDPDLILLDIMMPGLDGIEFCRQIRSQALCPILFLSAKIEEDSKIRGLSAGGDDYLTKPFSMKELHARIEAHLRREKRTKAHPAQKPAQVQYGAFWIDYGRKETGFNTDSLNFTKKEYMIIELLTSNAGLVFSQERIYETVWGYDAEGDANTAVTEHIKRIRKKLQQHSDSEFIETVWGIGYRWKK